MSMSSRALSSRLVLVLCLVTASVFAGGCDGRESSLAPAGQGDLDESGARTASGLDLESESDPAAGSGASAGVEENLALPVLVPAFGLGGNTAECKFTDDPYSTCI